MAWSAMRADKGAWGGKDRVCAGKEAAMCADSDVVRDLSGCRYVLFTSGASVG